MPRWVAPIALLFCVVLAAQSVRATQREGDARQQLREALEFADTALSRAVHATDAAVAWRNEADRLAAVAMLAQSESDQLKREAVRRELAFRDAASSAPDTCRPVIAAAESALAALTVTNDSLASAAHSWERSALGYRRIADSANAVVLDVSRALRDLQSAGEVVIDEPEPTLRQRIFAMLPRPGLGAACGVAVGGGVDCVTGFTLGWRF